MAGKNAQGREKGLTAKERKENRSRVDLPRPCTNM
jgi:hypothetical protein